MNKKKILALVLVVVLLLTAVGGTLAYFTDTEEATNVFTVGNVDIALREMGVVNGINYADEEYRDALADYKVMPNVPVGKKVWVDNIGNQPAYIRVVMTISKDLTPTWAETLMDEWDHSFVETPDSYIHTFERKAPLAANTNTGNLLESFVLNADVDSTTSDGTYEIPVYAYAIQSAGFETAKDAYAALVQKPLVYTGDAIYTTSSLITSGSNGVLQATGGTLTIEGNGIVNAEEADDHYAMAVWANGGNVVINGGTFIQSITGSDEKYDLIYASNGGDITIKGGTFKAHNPDWTLNVKDADRATSHITVMGGKFYRFDPSNAQTGEGEISIATGYKVVQNGDWFEVVPDNFYEDESGVWHITDAAGMFEFANSVNNQNVNYQGKTVVLDADIDLENKAWTPIGQTGQPAQFKGEFDGQGHTIKNLYADAGSNVILSNGENVYSVGLFGWLEQGAPVVKNLTVDGATMKGNHNVAVIAGYAYGTIENCHVKNATLINNHGNQNCGDKTGLIVGYLGEVAKIINCTGADSTITVDGRDAGQIVGAAKTANVIDCSATNVTVTLVKVTCDHSSLAQGGNVRNELIGRVL